MFIEEMERARREARRHLRALRAGTGNADELQGKYNEKRFQRAVEAKRARPFVFPLRFDFSAVGRTTPYKQTTNKQQFPVDVLAASHNFLANYNDVNMRVVGRDRYFSALDAINQILPKVWDFAYQGETQEAFPLPSPIPLGNNEQIAVDAYSIGNAPSAFSRYLNLIGERVFQVNSAEALLDADQGATANEWIGRRRVPEPRVLMMNVDFKNGGVAPDDTATAMQTNPQGEPLLIWGMRSQALQFSTFKMRVLGEDDWMSDYAPIWSLCGCYTALQNPRYFYFNTPVYLPADVPLEGDFINSGADEDATHFDQPNSGVVQTNVSFLATSL